MQIYNIIIGLYKSKVKRNYRKFLRFLSLS